MRLNLTPAVPFSHPLVCAALHCLVTFIKIDEWTAGIGKRLGSAKTTVKETVPKDRKERTEAADKKDQGAIAAQSDAVLIRPQGIWSEGAKQCT